ncbi:double-strand break repair helicase AddA [Curvivirga sp.]|uniref:double-strand break repair helicase AddA n=1 Tax=Curvivirga sp. TaxID=2856848 RepID=UPI003B5A709D
MSDAVSHTPIDPNILQRRASNPFNSVWVSASAGSGKTKVLTDRVLSLLLMRAWPEKILCITFTKAAAAEMSNRVNEKLGEWATMEEEKLFKELHQLMGIAPNQDDMQLARQLFARVLDTPGGLKILTVHSFCQSLLGRFPLEAGVSPNFQILDDRSANEMLMRAQDTILRAADQAGVLQSALKVVTRHSNEESFAQLMRGLIYERGRLKRLLDQRPDESPLDCLNRVEGELFDLLDAVRGVSEEDVIKEACKEGAFDRNALRDAMTHLQGGTKTDQSSAEKLASWLEADEAGRVVGYESYRSIFLTQKLDPKANVMTKKRGEDRPDILDVMLNEQDRIIRVQDRIARQVTATASAGVLRLGEAMLRAYETEKQARDLLDFDDLILKSVNLLTKEDGAAAWVMFKLDGGLDHVLIDEAQDTNPEQWQVVETLTREFFTGEGQYNTRPEKFERDVFRTIFAVGDEKQSIFSFQRADPREFNRMQGVFADLVKEVGQDWDMVPMDTSFRSTNAVLKTVDAVFENPVARDGVVPLEREIHHNAFRQGHGGRVEIWPVVQADRTVDPDPWLLPTETERDASPKQRLADALANQVASWIGHEDLPAKARKVRAGDIMVLVRRRDAFVDLLVRALKRKNIPVAGVDRMILSEQIVVMDLMVLAQFLIMPDDDLSLATLLKTPLLGLNDDDLFKLAHKRGSRSLWFNLREVGRDHPRFGPVVNWLSDLLARTDFIRPFELFSSILARPCPALDKKEDRSLTGREAMVARLGREVEDPLEEFLAMALSYEQGNAPSLQGFLHWFHAGQSEVKRDLEAGVRDEVKIMTVHGSKGLQAPIVIMPDTTSVPMMRDKMYWVKEGEKQFPVWTPSGHYQEAIGEKAKADLKKAQNQEYRRLLYVALTRAEDRLLVCGSAGTNGASADCWHELIEQGLSKIGTEVDFAAPIDSMDSWTGKAWIYEEAHTAEIIQKEEEIVAEKAQEEMPYWMRVAPGAEPMPPRPLIPSAATVEVANPPVRSPRQVKAQKYYKRGRLVHRLLQSLPDLPLAKRRDAALKFLAQPAHGIDEAYQLELADEVMAVMEKPEFASLFGPDSRAEVPVVGLIEGDKTQLVSGQIDRLIVSGTEVFIVDYKTLRPSPMDPADVPEAYLKQMASYRAVLDKIYPDHDIRCALLWTDGPRIMELDKGQLDLFSPTPYIRKK